MNDEIKIIADQLMQSGMEMDSAIDEAIRLSRQPSEEDLRLQDLEDQVMGRSRPYKRGERMARLLDPSQDPLTGERNIRDFGRQKIANIIPGMTLIGREKVFQGHNPLYNLLQEANRVSKAYHGQDYLKELHHRVMQAGRGRVDKDFGYESSFSDGGQVFASDTDKIAQKLMEQGLDQETAMAAALRMAQSRQQADQSILGGVPTQPPVSDVPPATEILGGDPSKLFQRQPTTMERIKDLPKDVLGAGEALVSMGSLAALAPASMMYALRPGQKTQGDPMEFALRNMYMPRSERGPSHLAGLGEVLESLPQTGPLPELQAFAGVGRGVGRQLAEKGRQAGRAMAPAAANVAEDILRRQGLLMDVVKPKGGNWLTGSVENALAGLQQRTAGRSDPKEMMAEMKRVYTPEVINTLSSETRALVTAGMQDLERKISLNNWIDRNLTNYIKKEMATPEDPVRKLAEQGITHLPENAVQAGSWIPENLGVTRMNEGFDPLGMGQSELAKNWETLSDTAINVSPASKHTAPLTQSEIRRGYKSTVDENPWLTKVPPDTRIYYPESGEIDGLGFDHIVDVLRQDLAEGRIRPEQLNKVSMEQAVRRTYEYDQEMAKKMREAQIKATEGMPLVKEYPEQGFKWVELKSESDPKLTESALKYEGETMGHCVGGYCPDVLEGRSQIFSLRDAKGEPHVTIEVQPVKMSQSEAVSQARGEGLKGFEFASRVSNLMEGKDIPPKIVQIKGKQNRAPKEEYLPFVQDFVRSNKWTQVGDIENTGLMKLGDEFVTKQEAVRIMQPQILEAQKFLMTDPSLQSLREAQTRYERFDGRVPSPEYTQLQKEAGKPISKKIPYTFGELKAILSDPESFAIRGESVYDPALNALKLIKQYKEEINAAKPQGMAAGGHVKAVESARRALEKAMAKGGIAKAVGKAAAKAGSEAAERIAKNLQEAADKGQVVATPAEIDRALASSAKRIGKDNPKLTPDEIEKKAARDVEARLKWERIERPSVVKEFGQLADEPYTAPKARRLQNVPAEVEARAAAAEEFLRQPTEPWQPPKPGLQAFDRSLIKESLEGFPGVEQTRFPRYQPARADIGYVGEMYDNPRNRELIKQQIKRGLPLGGETFYGSLYPLKVAALERGIPAEKFEQFIYQTAPASARNSIMNEMAVGQFLRDMNARGLPLDEQTVAKEMANFKQKYGIGLPLMPVHRQGVQQVIEGGTNLREQVKADIPTNYKIPTYGTQKAGDFGKSVVLDVHEAAGETLGSQYHPYFTRQGGFGPTEYGIAESKMLDIANELGIPGGMAQAGRWFGGGELTGLKSPRGDALDLLEKQTAYTLQGQGIKPTPRNVRNYILDMIDTGQGVLMPYFKSEAMPDVRTMKKKGGAVKLGGLAALRK